MEKSTLQSRVWSVLRHLPVILIATLLETARSQSNPTVREFMSYSSLFGENIIFVTIAYGVSYGVYRIGEGRFSGRIWILTRSVGSVVFIGIAFLTLLAVLDHLSGNSLDLAWIFAPDNLAFGALLGTFHYAYLWIARQGLGLAVPERYYQNPW